MKLSTNKIGVLAAVGAMALSSGVAQARHGADDPAGHKRHGADDVQPHFKHGADDKAGHKRHHRGHHRRADDGPNHR